MKLRTLSVLLSLAPAALGAQQPRDPVAAPPAVVRVGSARFTVLTDRMIRMEWARGGHFEDSATIVIVNRRLPVPHFRTYRDGAWTVVKTDALTLRYRRGSGRFTADNLDVRVATGGVDTTWHPGEANPGNLGGTIRTLDGVKGPVPLGEGLVSRSGWALVDDSKSPLLTGTARWAAARTQGPHQDWYFLGYGHDYTAALGDFAKVSGRMPIPPHFAFGIWWSRYWAYTDQELKTLVKNFELYHVPLDVLVIDMDWHNTFGLRWGRTVKDQAGEPKGWTGYTWNRAYFPEPKTFLSWVHRQGLKVTLNLHPASGIQPWEVQYPAMARAMGIDPATKKYVPFRITNQKFAKAYFDLVIHPLERQGVNFWWLDWQQYDTTAIPNLHPTIWLNDVFYTDMERQGQARPLILHRYGGLGSQRYQVGFSGDAASTWQMLAFEPQFTSTAANVLYGYWSHDIGGHLPGPVSGQLYTRWVQFGALSPVLRTHTTKNPKAERRIWAFAPQYFQAMRAAMLFRTSLVPYLYTAARHAYDTGVSMLRPLYYGWPDLDAAYTHEGQYMLGPDLMVSPVTAPADSATGLATRTTWLPPGDWIEWDSGARLHGPGEVTRTYLLDEIPLFVRAGAVIPMQEPTTRVGNGNQGPRVVTVFPGADGSARLYEDEGNDDGYKEGQDAWTSLSSHWSDEGRTLEVEVGATKGSYPGMRESRGLVIQLPDQLPPASVEADGRGVPQQGGDSIPGWTYDGTHLETVIRLPAASVRQARTVLIRFPAAPAGLMDGAEGLLHRMAAARSVLEGLWPADWPSDAYVALSQTGRRIELKPETAVAEMEALRDSLPGIVAEIPDMQGSDAIKQKALAILGQD